MHVRGFAAVVTMALVANLAVGLPHQPAAGQGAVSETWMPVLRLQLARSHNCTLERVMFVRETPLAGDVGLDGRVRCIEGREYDFSRQRAHQAFEIRLCQPAVC
jgi:hypothetical protein